MTDQTQPPENLSIARNLKLGLFHIGSAMADVLGAGVWNRVMIENLGYAATPVGLLLALRYFLSPFAMWAGARSDHTNLRGYRRLPWIWSGRLGMIGGYLLIAFSTVELVGSGSGWWLGIIAGFVIASVGYSISGSTFLALVYDRAPVAQRGRAVGIVWTFLLAGYAVAGVGFSRMLPEYAEDAFLRFFLSVAVIILALWLVALWGEEKRRSGDPQVEREQRSLDIMGDLRALLGQPSARSLAWFMLFSFAAAFMQDSLLEPFGGAVFDLSVGETTRFQAYWGTMAIISSGLTIWGHRRFEYTYQDFTRWGVIILAVTFAGLTATAFTARESLLRPALLLLGVGYGLWNIGTLGMMVQNSRQQSAGMDLGAWTMVVTICRGGAVFLGAVLFDIFQAVLDDRAAAYGLVFALEAILLVMSLRALGQVGEIKIVDYSATEDLILSSSLD